MVEVPDQKHATARNSRIMKKDEELTFKTAASKSPEKQTKKHKSVRNNSPSKAQNTRMC